MRFLQKFAALVLSRFINFDSQELPVNKPSPRITFCTFGCQASKFSYSPLKTPTDMPSLDQEAQELAGDLREMADKSTIPLQLTPPRAHEQLLERLRLSGLYAEVNEFSCTQWQLLSDGLIGNGADGVFMADEEIRPDCQVATLARSGTSVVHSPLELLEAIAQLHSGGLAVWLFWYRDFKTEDFPVAVCCDNQGAMAGWVVAPRGGWWPLAELEMTIEFLLKSHDGDVPAEQDLIDEIVAHIKEDMGPQTILGFQNDDFISAVELCSAAQHDLMQNCVAQSRRIAQQQGQIELERAPANVTGVLRARAGSRRGVRRALCSPRPQRGPPGRL
jgi:hypothetical protein